MTQSTQKLFVLEASGDGHLFSINPDGSGRTDLVTGCRIPDGVAIDVAAGHIYWTNMGMPPPANDRMFVTDLGGNIYVATLDGSGHRPIRALQGNLTGIAYAELPDGSNT